MTDESIRQNPSNIRLALVCALALCLLTAVIANPLLISGELALVHWVLRLRDQALTNIIWLLTFISSAVPALVITLVVSGIELRRAKGVRLESTWATIAFLGATASNIAMRVSLGRQPPAVNQIPHLLPEVQADFQRFSYPSGHAGAAFIAYASILALLWPYTPWRYPGLVATVLIIGGVGFGRVYLGVHWPTDVIAGYLLGACWLNIGLAIRQRKSSAR